MVSLPYKISFVVVVVVVVVVVFVTSVEDTVIYQKKCAKTESQIAFAFAVFFRGAHDSSSTAAGSDGDKEAHGDDRIPKSRRCF